VCQTSFTIELTSRQSQVGGNQRWIVPPNVNPDKDRRQPSSFAAPIRRLLLIHGKQRTIDTIGNCAECFFAAPSDKGIPRERVAT
jgi:hypothetical protein